MKSQQQKPCFQSFKVPYQQCKTHEQKLNYICLDPACHQNSLICSLCKDQPTHSKHTIRPLKFYLQELKDKYQQPQNQSNLNILLQQLELSQFAFYQSLKKTVQQVALQFQKLQEQVSSQINQIRNQIYQEMAKRNQFNQFYENLKRGNIDHANFFIQNYLPKSTVGKLQNIHSLDALMITITTQIQQTKDKLISRQSTQGNLTHFTDKKQSTPFIPLDLITAIKKPPTILFQGNILKQTSIYNGSGLCLIDYPVQKLTGKIAFKMIQMKKGGNVIIGVLPKKVYDSLGNNWANNKIGEHCYVLGNAAYNHGWDKCEIVGFAQSSNLELSCKNNELKVIQKNKISKAKVPSDVDLFIVISISGESQVRITHIK